MRFCKNMDKIDLKIIKALLKNGRISTTQLAKRVRISRENTHYRMEQLTKKEIIREFVTQINYRALGYIHHTVFLEYNKITKEIEKELLYFLKNSVFVSWIGLLTGKWSITFDIFTKKQKEIDSFLSDLLSKFQQSIKNYRIMQIADSNYYFEKLIASIHKMPMKKPEKKFKYDQQDIKIIEKLNKNTRAKYTDIAKKLNLSANAIKIRIKKLEHSGLIQGYSVSLNHLAFGYEWQGIQIKIEIPNKAVERKIKSYVANNEKIIFLYHYTKTGMYDYDIGVLVRDSSELREFINEFRTIFHDAARIEDTFLVLKEVSSHRLPSIIFKSD